MLGGYHLLQDDDASIRKIANRFQEMNVRHVAPTHCSGRKAQQIFKAMYGEGCLDGGVGRVVTAKDLPGITTVSKT